jgi:hypothetical protein
MGATACTHRVPNFGAAMFGKSLLINELNVVEAAGVEPASENTSSQTATCVSSFDMSRPDRNEAKSPGRPSRKI